VLLPGSPATYANRAFLKGLGLRWDPDGHRWHGTTSAENVRALREQLGLEVRCFGTLDVRIEIAPRGPAAPKPFAPAPVSRPRVHDGSRTHLESRIAFPTESDETEEITASTRRFTLAEITSGLPDDSREEDERREARHLRDLRGRVKHARALVASTPGLAGVLVADWRRAAAFYARFGITEQTLRYGVPPTSHAGAPRGTTLDEFHELILFGNTIAAASTNEYSTILE
jgi:hypothetical protein